MPRPYQPSQLRLLHGAVALVAAGSWLSGVVVYSNFDGRLARLPLRFPGEWIDWHGSLGVALLLLGPLLAIYAVSLGAQKLRHPTNWLPLLGLALALFSGLFMQEEWLEEHQLNHWPYLMHLGGWLLLTITVAAHVVGILRRGGTMLAISMLSLKLQSGDRPGDWPGQWLGFWQRFGRG